jgi:signal transduction histidine kinase
MPASGPTANSASRKQRLRELAQHLQTSIEQERAAIAREIHDDVGGSLTALKFDLAWIARHSDRPKGCACACKSALETVTLAIESSQRIMHNLRPAILEQGLVAALQWMPARFERAPASPASCALPHADARVARRRAAGRLSHRAGGADQRHQARPGDARADRPVAGRRRDVAGDQRQRPGPQPQDLAKARSFGIRGLHERAGTVGGWVDLSSGPAGTTLILSVPLNPIGTHRRQPAHPLREPDDPSQWGTL